MSTEINQGSNRETPRQSTLGDGRFTNGKWFCGCKREAALRTVKRDIPTKDKKFWRCPRIDEQDKQCSFYIWLDHETAVKEWLKVSRQPPVPQTPTRTGVAYDEPGPSTVSGLRDKQSLPQVPKTPFTTPKRKRVSIDITTHDDRDDDFDGRLDVNGGPCQPTMAMDDPFANPRHHSEHTRTAARTSTLSTPGQHSTEWLESRTVPLPTPDSGDRMPARNGKAAQPRLLQPLEMSPTPGRSNKRTNPEPEGESDLTTTVLELIHRDNLKLKHSTEVDLIYEIGMQLDVREAKLRRQEETIGKLRKKLKEMEKAVEEMETAVLR